MIKMLLTELLKIRIRKSVITGQKSCTLFLEYLFVQISVKELVNPLYTLIYPLIPLFLSPLEKRNPLGE